MSTSQKFTFKVRNRSIEVLAEQKTVLKRFWRRKFFFFGSLQMRDENHRLLASFDHEFPKSFSYDCNITITGQGSNGRQVIKYYWKKPHATATIGNDAFTVVFHKAMRASIFNHGNQIAQLNIPKLEAFSGKEYVLIVRHGQPVDVLFWLIFGIIYKLEVSDNSDGATIVFTSGLIGPFQTELSAFDPHWLNGPNLVSS